jgi:hypothetical protein
MDRKKVRIIEMNSKGHIVLEKELSEFIAEGKEPGYIIIVNGQVCRTEDEILRACDAESEPQVIKLPTLTGG